MTGIIIAKNYDDRYHVTDITTAQQQSGDLELIGELNFINKYDHRMINIDELIND